MPGRSPRSVVRYIQALGVLRDECEHVCARVELLEANPLAVPAFVQLLLYDLEAGDRAHEFEFDGADGLDKGEPLSEPFADPAQVSDRLR